ncbi:MAG TPA: phage holin family protein [Solirubrobacteraceae bacterium]|nr:phage holin family protein [Solirubrobacteraceae bacterium]
MAETDRPVGELLKELSQQTSTLVRQELELARLELTDKGRAAGFGLGMFGGAGAFGFWMLGALTATVILLLATTMRSWLAALIVTAALGLAAGVLALTGRKKLRDATPPQPEQATASVKEDVQWTRSAAARGRS